MEVWWRSIWNTHLCSFQSSQHLHRPGIFQGYFSKILANLAPCKRSHWGRLLPEYDIKNSTQVTFINQRFPNIWTVPVSCSDALGGTCFGLRACNRGSILQVVSIANKLLSLHRNNHQLNFLLNNPQLFGLLSDQASSPVGPLQSLKRLYSSIHRICDPAADHKFPYRCSFRCYRDNELSLRQQRIRQSR